MHRSYPLNTVFQGCEVATEHRLTKVVKWARGGNKKTAAYISLLFLQIGIKILNQKV